MKTCLELGFPRRNHTKTGLHRCDEDLFFQINLITSIVVMAMPMQCEIANPAMMCFLSGYGHDFSKINSRIGHITEVEKAGVTNPAMTMFIVLENPLVAMINMAPMIMP